MLILLMLIILVEALKCSDNIWEPKNALTEVAVRDALLQHLADRKVEGPQTPAAERDARHQDMRHLQVHNKQGQSLNCILFSIAVRCVKHLGARGTTVRAPVSIIWLTVA